VARTGGRIEEYSPPGKLIHVLVLPGASATSDLPSIAVGSDGTLAVLDRDASRVWEITPSGAVLHRWGGPGTAPGEFNVPSGVAVDAHGRVYVSDSGNGRIEVFSRGGRFLYPIVLTKLAGNSGIHPYPVGLALDVDGNLYVADAFLDSIFKLSPGGRLLARIGSSGSGSGHLRSPQAVAVDGQGRVYVADTGNRRVQVFSPSGSLLQVVGRSGRRGSPFDRPSSLAVDWSGDVYVADRIGNRLQKFISPVGGKQ
jgi:DNA-binding beta-propeller fold protein YncE